MNRDTNTKSSCFILGGQLVYISWTVIGISVCIMLPLLFHTLISVVLWVEYMFKRWLFRGTSSLLHLQRCIKP